MYETGGDLVTAIAKYDPQLFDELPSLDEAERSLGTLPNTLSGVAGILSARGVEARIGLGLLHRHFRLDDSERLVEVVDLEERTAVGQPQLAIDAASSSVPHLFRAVQDGDCYRWHPLEYVQVGQASARALAAQTWLAAQTELLNEIAAYLDQEGALDVFGVSLEHGREEIDCAEDEVLLEETSVAARRLTMRPYSLNGLQGRATPTNWSVSDGQVKMRCTCQRAGDERHGHFETN